MNSQKHTTTMFRGDWQKYSVYSESTNCQEMYVCKPKITPCEKLTSDLFMFWME
jgi:hypothetical protein